VVFCAGISAAEQLIRQGVRPEYIKFIDSYRTKNVYIDAGNELKNILLMLAKTTGWYGLKE